MRVLKFIFIIAASILFCYVAEELINYLIIKPRIPMEFTYINLTKAGNKAELYINNKDDKICRYFTLDFVSYDYDRDMKLLDDEFANTYIGGEYDVNETLLRGTKIPLSLKIYKIDNEPNKFGRGKEYFYYKLKPVFAEVRNLRPAYMQTSIYRGEKHYDAYSATIACTPLQKGMYKVELENLQDLPIFSNVKIYFTTKDSGLKY